MVKVFVVIQKSTKVYVYTSYGNVIKDNACCGVGKFGGFTTTYEHLFGEEKFGKWIIDSATR